jgi:PGF-pre-PGF domain-containing protein
VAALLSIILLAGGAFAAASIAGTWQNPQETMTFYDDGSFSGKNTQIGVFNGMYSIKENILTLNYAFPAAAATQFTFAVSGSTLELSLISQHVTYTKISGASSDIAGTWQYSKETLNINANGRFDQNNVLLGILNGTYTVQGNILTFNYAYPVEAAVQFTFAISGNTLQLSLISPQATYTRIDAAAATSTPPAAATPAPTPKPTEPPENIVKVEKDNKNLVENTPVTYTFKEPEHGISEITVTGAANQNDVSVKVEVLKSTAKSVSEPPPGEVYKNLNIVVGTTNIKEAVIKFNVENSWLAGNNLASGDVRMIKWDGSKWNTLETSEKNTDGKVTYYEAKTGSFSSFAITGLKAMATPAMDSSPDSASPAAVQTKKASGFGVILALGTFYMVYLFGRKRI